MDQSRALDDDIDDLPTARALIASLQEQLTKSQREIAALRHELDILCQRLFGKKSERVDPRQLQLALEQLKNERGPVTEPVEMDSGETPVRGHTRHRPTGRRPLPAHVPRRRVEIDISDTEKRCACGHTRTRIGEDIAEKLEYEPASFVVIETVRPKYACPHCHEGVVQAPAPPQAVEKSLAGEGLLAHVVVSKYVDHLPLHRLEGIFARERIDLPRSTLCGWVADVATVLTRLASTCVGRSPRPTICRPMIRRSPSSPSAAAASRAVSGPISIRSRTRSVTTVLAHARHPSVDGVRRTAYRGQPGSPGTSGHPRGTERTPPLTRPGRIRSHNCPPRVFVDATAALLAPTQPDLRGP